MQLEEGHELFSTFCHNHPFQQAHTQNFQKK